MSNFYLFLFLTIFPLAIITLEYFILNFIGEEKKALICKYRFLFYSIISLFISMSIPLLSIIEIETLEFKVCSSKLLAAYLSSLLTLISSYIFLINPREKWYQYRKVAEALKVTPFNLDFTNDKYEDNFIKIINEIITKDHQEWYDNNNNNNKNKNKNSNNSLQSSE